MNAISFIEFFVRREENLGTILNLQMIDLVTSIENSQQLILRKNYPRCVGKTFTLVAYALYETMIKGQKVGYFVNNINELEIIKNYYKYAYENLPNHLQSATSKCHVAPVVFSEEYHNSGSINLYATLRVAGDFKLTLMDEIIENVPNEWFKWIPKTAKVITIGTFGLQ